MNRQDDEPFLARWSRRKRSGAADPDAKAREPNSEPKAAPAADEPAIDLATLPKIEDLTSSSDLTVFLQRGVPDLLRQQAVRRMWSLDPSIRDFVEMAENQYDWNVPGGAPGFGDLDSGTDVAALLDQALGKWPGPEPASGDTTPQTAALDATCEPPAALDDAAKIPALTPGSTSLATSTTDGAHGPRVSHGGALPT